MIGIAPKDAHEELNYTELLTRIKNNAITHVMITNNTLYARKVDSKISIKEFGARYDISAILPGTDQFSTDVRAIYAEKLGIGADKVQPTDYAFETIIQPPQAAPWWMEWLPFLISFLLLGGLLYFMMRQQTGANRGVMSFGRSRARLSDPTKNTTTFANVAGLDEEKEELREIVEFLKNPKRFLDIGARIPKGVLLLGPPGNGKTLLARAVAGEAGVPFFSISGSDFVEMFVGVGASRVRDLFDQAKRHMPSIVFIDEIDAVGRHRGAGLGGGHDEREQTLNQLLVEMDGFAVNEGVIVMAATNRADILDPALLRPGRFDRQVTVNYPDVKGREEILRLHSAGKPLADDVDLQVLARRTPYFTGADLENVMNEGAILTARAMRHQINMSTLEEAINRVSAGPEKKSRKVTERDRQLVAYHEAGHAIVIHYTPECDKVHEVSIVPRGRGIAGYTMPLPDEELQNFSSAKLKAQISSLLAGHCAEQLALGDISTGSTSDLKRATQLARNMVTEYGMSRQLGPIFLGGDQEVFVGRNFTQTHSELSEEITSTVDREIRHILEEGYKNCTAVLSARMEQLHALAKRLLEKEKLDRSEFEALMQAAPAMA
jgi:cell division protease FtsH